MGAIERGFIILAILMKKSSVKHPLSYKDIQRMLLDEYNIKVNYRTVKGAVNELSIMLGIAEDDKGRVFVI